LFILVRLNFHQTATLHETTVKVRGGRQATVSDSSSGYMASRQWTAYRR